MVRNWIYSLFTLSWFGPELVLGSPLLTFSEDANKGWRFGVAAELYSWSQNGSLVNNVDYSKYVRGSFVANGESLNLPRVASPAVTFSAFNRRWDFGVYYMPVHFEGSGTGLAVVSDDRLGGFVRESVDANMSVDFLLARASYRVISSDTASLRVGIGAGQVDIDMLLSTEGELDFSYLDRQPYGYLSIDMANRHGRFYYGFALNTFKIHAGEVQEDHIDYRIDFGFRVYQASTPLDLMMGWRHLDIQFDIENSDSRTSADFDISGPYIGLSLTL